MRILLYLFTLIILTGCGSLRKLKENIKSNVRTDSTAVAFTSKDSTATSSTKTFTDGTETVTIEFHPGQDTAAAELKIYAPTKDDYFWRVQSKKPPKSVKVERKNVKSEEKKSSADVQQQTSNKVEVKKEVKERTAVKQVKRTNYTAYLLWLLLLIVAAVLWWKRHTVKKFIQQRIPYIGTFLK